MGFGHRDFPRIGFGLDTRHSVRCRGLRLGAPSTYLGRRPHGGHGPQATDRLMAILNAPNTISMLRIALAPVLLWLAWTRQPAFAFVLALSLMSDILDG